MRGLKRLAGNLLLLAVSLLVSLAAAEAFLRAFRPVQYLKPPTPPTPAAARASLYRPSRIPGISYEMAPGRNGEFEGMPVRTNSLGYRGGEPLPAGEGGYRILALGDSFTFGFGLPEADTYPAVLERRLNESEAAGDRRFEVLNLGVVGYTSRDEAAILRARGLPLRPRLVVIGYVLNDPEIDPRQSLHKYFDPPVWWRRFHTLRLLHLGWNHLQVWRYGGGDYLRYLHSPGREKWRSVEAAFDAVHGMARSEGFPVVVAIFPLTPDRGWEGYRYRDLHAQVARLAEAEGFQVVDLYPVYRRYPPTELRLSPQDDHPSRLGQRLAGEALAEAVLALLPATPATPASDR